MANIEALRLLRDLEDAGRPATTAEQEVLARWSGWGAIPGIFDPEDARWDDLRQALHGLLGDDWTAARRTVLNAHYTDPSVVAAMWDAAQAYGFDTGRVLEPGCGAGTFIAYAPEGAAMVGVEQDPTTAAIAQQLYPDAEIHASPFERFDPRTPFDLALGNVPFADIAPADARYNRGRHSIHNYFLLKSLQLVRPGGLVMALTSRYTLDARNPAARRELSQHGDLLGALRLPNGAMRRIADTDAILDLVVLRRREPGAAPAGADGWDATLEVDVFDETTQQPSTTRVNRYLAEHPDHVLGETVLGRGLYRSGELMVRGAADGLAERVAAMLSTIVEDSDWRYMPTPARTTTGPRQVRLVGDIELRSERIDPLRRDNFVVSATGVIYRHVDGELGDAEVPKSATDEVRTLIDLRDRALNLLHFEAGDAPDQEIESARRELSDSYDRYRRRWGPLNRVTWQDTGKLDPATGERVRRRIRPRLGGFRRDPDWPTLAAIEVYDEDTGVAEPAAILRQRTIHPPAPRLGADTAEEALAVVLDERGRLELDRIAELLGVDAGTARAEIEPFVYDDPDTGHLVPAEEYLSGKVPGKLTRAEAAAERDPRFERNVVALQEIQPRQIEPGEIVVRPGVPWIPTSDLADFLRETVDVSDAQVTYTPALGSWGVNVPSWARSSVAMRNDWGTRRMSADRLFEATLNQRLVRVYDTVDDKRVVNVDQTAAAREKQERLAERFSSWAWEDPSRAARLAERYNELFNSYVPARYSGDHLTFPGLVSTFRPHAHQRAAVARILREGRCLLGHAVGAGKTATMVMAGMELRRLGTASRPAYVVPNHMLEQFGREMLQLYPQARVLITTKDLTGPTGRENFVARAATGDWDAVVITHSAFERLPLREETYARYVADRTTGLRASLARAMSEDGNGKGLVKQLEAAIAREEARLERSLDAAAKDDGVSFEASGIDFLFVDELHLFKNKAVVTGVEGVSATGSKRATDLDAKLWYLQQTAGPRVLVGATATPIANSITEAWIMQTYLQPDVLAESGLDSFDAWAATFAQQVAAIELAPDGGSYRMTSRLARYRNVPELIAQFRRTTDIRQRDDLDLALPRLRGGTPETVVVPASDQLADYVEGLVDRAEAVRSGHVAPTDDNMLKITSDGRHAALDLRLVGRRPDPTGGKLAVAADRIAGIYHDTRHLTYTGSTGQIASRPGAFQIVFCDLSTPTNDASWNAYDELRRRLVSAGIPSTEVAYIHDAKNDDTRAQLFERCRNGQIAVLVGSTQKMGVGTNIHTRAIALHHIDCPWRPADIEQREGRIIRQGNQNPEVEIVRYATEASFDVYMWQTCERKAAFIEQVMRNTQVGRDIDDVGDTVLSYAEVKALATGNPLVIEQAGVQAELTKLERLEAAHRDEQHTLVRNLERARSDAGRQQARALAYEAAIARRTDTTGDRFSIELDGTCYTKRVEGGQVLLERIRRAVDDLAQRPGEHAELPHRVVGRLGGFPVELDAWRLSNHTQVRLGVVLNDHERFGIRLADGDIDAKKPDALIGQLEGPLRRLDHLRDEAFAHARESRDSAAEMEARVGQPFPEKDRLDALRRRYHEILDSLNNDTAATPDRRATEPAEAASASAARLEELTRRPRRDSLEGPTL